MNICPNKNNPKIALEFNDIVLALNSEDLAYDFWDLNGGFGADKLMDGSPSTYYQKMILSGRSKEIAIRARYAAYRMQRDIDLSVATKSPLVTDGILKRNRMHAIDRLREAGLLNRQDANVNKYTKLIVDKNYTTKRYYNRKTGEFRKAVLLDVRTGEYWNKVDLILRQYGLTAEIVNGNELRIPERVIMDPEIDRSTRDSYITGRLCKFLSAKTGVNYVICNNREDFKQKVKASGIYLGIDLNPNALYATSGNTVYIIKGITSSKATVEEFMHPIVTALQYFNTNTFDLILRALRTSNDSNILAIIREASITYANFDQQTIDNEIVAHYLAECLNSSLFHKYAINWGQELNRFAVNVFDNIHDSYTEYIKDEYGFTDEDIKNNKLFTFDIFSKDFKLNNFNDLVKLFNYHNVKIDGLHTNLYQAAVDRGLHLLVGELNDKLPKAFYNLYNSDLQKFNIADKISKYYQDLFKSYRLDSSKSVIDAKRENAIKETIIRLRGQNNKDALSVFLLDAFQQIGLTDTFNANPDCVVNLMQKYAKDGYKTMPLSEILNLYSRVYDTYKQIYDTIYGNLSNDELSKEKLVDEKGNELGTLLEALTLVRNSLDDLYKLITEALFVAAEKFANLIINETAGRTLMTDKDGKPVYLGMNAEKFSRYRDLMIDWFMYNYFNHDVTVFDFFKNFDASSNVATANIAYLIQRLKSLASERSYNRIVRIMNLYKELRPKVSIGNWQKTLMEFDRNGYPTGYFASKYNYGQCEQDMQAEINQYVKDWGKLHGYTYQVNQYDSSVDYNSLTGEPFYNETWEYDLNGNPIAPDWIEFLRGIEKIKGKYIERRYTEQYYLERLSKPFREDDSNPGHGLSPRTRYYYDLAQSLVNYFLDKCYDETDGFSHPERLSAADQEEYDMYKQKLEDLANPFDHDGIAKSSEDFQMAQEIQAWNAYCQSKFSVETFRHKFENHVSELKHELDEAEASGDLERINKASKALNDFYKYNAKYDIAPEYYQMAFGNSPKHDDYLSDVYRQLRRSLANSTRDSKNNLVVDLNKYEDTAGYFLLCRYLDQKIGDAEFAEKSQSDEDDSSNFKEWFTSQAVLYRDGNGMYTDAYTGLKSVSPTNSSKTFKAHLLEHWVEKIVKSQDKTIEGLVDLSGQLMDFSGMSEPEIMKWLDENVLTYEKTVFVKDKDGNYVLDADRNRTTKVVRLNISCLSQLLPSKSEIVVYGRKISSITWNPSGRVYTEKYNSKSSNQFVNENFDKSVGTQYHPKASKYTNTEYGKLLPELLLLMDALTEEIKRCFNDMGFEGIYDNRVPLIEAGGSAMISRWFRSPKSSILKFIDNYFTGLRQDSDIRDVRDLPVDFTGNRKYTLATRFMNKLQDPKHLSTDLVCGVMLLIIESENFKAFKAIENEILTADKVMNKQSRGGDQSKMSAKLSNSYTYFRKMLLTMYYQESGLGFGSDLPLSVKSRRIWTIIGTFVGVASLQMLGFNTPSAVAGFVGSTIYLLSYFGQQTGRLNLTDIVYSIGRSLPSLIYSLVNCGTILPSSKIPALMYLNDLSKSKREGFRDTYKSRLRKVGSHLAMAVFEMCDRIGNSFLTVAMYKNYRLIDSLDKYGIDPGFYSWEELKNIAELKGISKSIIRMAYYIKSRNKTLFDAYNFSHKSKQLNIEDWAKDYVTSRLKENVRSRLNNGAALVNGLGNSDIPSPYEKHIGVRSFFGMRKWAVNATNEVLGGNNTYRHTTEKKSNDNDVNSLGRTVKGSKEEENKSYGPMTNEDRYYRGHFNPATGREDSAIFRNFFQGLLTIYYRIKLAMINDKNSKMKPKFNKGQKKAFYILASAAITYIAMLFTLPLISQWAHYPLYINKSNIQDGMNGSQQEIALKYTTGIANTPSEYFLKGVWRMMLYNAYERGVSSYFNNYVPGIGMVDFFTAPFTQTQLLQNTGNLNFGDAVEIWWDAFWRFLTSRGPSDASYVLNKDDLVRSGGYKKYPKKVYNMQKGIGLSKNIHTSTSNPALENNTSYYRDNLGTIGQSANSFRSVNMFGKHVPIKDYWMNHGPYLYNPNKTKEFKSPYRSYSNTGFAAPPPPPAPVAPPPPPPAP